MSLDGFATDAGGSADLLYPDLAEVRDAPYVAEPQAGTGAVLMGRRTFEMAGDPDGYADTHELRLSFAFVTDGVHAAVERAVATAGERAVAVAGGVDLNRQLLSAGLADELHVDVMPVLLDAGLRLFEGTGSHTLEKIGVVEAGARTSPRFRVQRAERRRR